MVCAFPNKSYIHGGRLPVQLPDYMTNFLVGLWMLGTFLTSACIVAQGHLYEAAVNEM